MPISIVVLSQVLYIVVFIVHAQDTFDCTGHEDDSFHPIYDATDCRHYWHCIYVNTVYMHAVRRVCPAGTEFDAELKQCETSSLVDCRPILSLDRPKPTTTTRAWKWRHSRLFSQKNWRTTRPYYATTRRRAIFDLGDSTEDDTTTITTTTMVPRLEATIEHESLPFASPPRMATKFSLEQLSKDLHAVLMQRRPTKKKPSAKIVQPGDPENEIIVYQATQQPLTTSTRYSAPSTSIPSSITTTIIPIASELVTSESLVTDSIISTTTTLVSTTITSTTTISTTITTDATMIAQTTTTKATLGFLSSKSTLSATAMAQPDSTLSVVNVNPKSRMIGQKRRNNMTLYILTSGDHKIRRFSLNHTRGFLINCNQLRRRLLGRRRLRDTFQITTDTPQKIQYSSTSSDQIFHRNRLSLTMLFFIFFTKIIIIT